MQTKITTASVRIALAYNFNTFEVKLDISNENGLQQSEINNARLQADELAKTAISDYKKNEKVIVGESMPVFDADKNLDELLKKANSKKK